MQVRKVEMLFLWLVRLCVIVWNGRVSRTAHELIAIDRWLCYLAIVRGVGLLRMVG
jgi:hypothetical protein